MRLRVIAKPHKSSEYSALDQAHKDLQQGHNSIIVAHGLMSDTARNPAVDSELREQAKEIAEELAGLANEADTLVHSFEDTYFVRNTK
jgi:hypothetical protein